MVKKERSKYQLLYFIRYLGDSFIYPFLTLFLSTGIKHVNTTNIVDYFEVVQNGAGYSKTQIGYLMMIFPLVAMFINPLWALLSKNINQSRKFALIFSTIEGLLILLMTFFGQDFRIMILIFFLMAVVGQPMYHLIDSFTKVFIDTKNIEFLTIRIFASIAYVVGSAGAGLLLYLSRNNYKILFSFAAISFILSSLFMFIIKPISKENAVQAREKANPKKLFSNPNYFLYVGLFLLVYGSLSSFDTFLPTYMKDVYRFKDEYMGYLVAGHVLVEVILMFIIAKVGKKIPIRVLVYAMIIGQSIRFMCYVLEVNIYLNLFITSMRSLTMTIYIYLYLRLIFKVIAPENITLGLIVGGSLMSAYHALLVFMGGKIIDTTKNYQFWYLLGMLFTVAGAVYYEVLARTLEERKEKVTILYQTDSMRVNKIVSSKYQKNITFLNTDLEYGYLLSGKAIIYYEDGTTFKLNGKDFFTISPNMKHWVLISSYKAIWLTYHFK